MSGTQYDEFCNRMRNYRKRLGYNQTQMGKALGMSQDDYCKREKGHTIVSYGNLKSLQELGVDIDELVSGSRQDIDTADLDELIEGYDDDRKTTVMRMIAEMILFYRKLDIKNGTQSTKEDRLLNYVIKQWDEFSMLEYVRYSMHYSQDIMSSKLCVTQKKYRQYEKELIYPDADTLLNMYNVYSCRPSLYLNIYDRRYYAIQCMWVHTGKEQKDKVIQVASEIKKTL